MCTILLVLLMITLGQSLSGDNTLFKRIQIKLAIGVCNNCATHYQNAYK